MFNKTRAPAGQIWINTRTERRLAVRDKAAFDRRIDKMLARPSGFHCQVEVRFGGRIWMRRGFRIEWGSPNPRRPARIRDIG
jgi:hypothetical protein